MCQALLSEIYVQVMTFHYSYSVCYHTTECVLFFPWFTDDRTDSAVYVGVPYCLWFPEVARYLVEVVTTLTGRPMIKH